MQVFCYTRETLLIQNRFRFGLLHIRLIVLLHVPSKKHNVWMLLMAVTDDSDSNSLDSM